MRTPLEALGLPVVERVLVILDDEDVRPRREPAHRSDGRHGSGKEVMVSNGDEGVSWHGVLVMLNGPSLVRQVAQPAAPA